jgi:hypothetical protein
MKKSKKSKSSSWFISVRGSYLPNSWEGALTYIPFIGYIVFITLEILNHNGTFKYKTLLIVSQWIFTAMVMTWFAKNHSK